MYTYIYIYMYIYICIYTYIYLYMYTYIHTYIYSYMYIYYNIHTFIYVHIYIHTHAYMFIYIYTYLLRMFMFMTICLYLWEFIYPFNKFMRIHLNENSFMFIFMRIHLSPAHANPTCAMGIHLWTYLLLWRHKHAPLLLILFECVSCESVA